MVERVTAAPVVGPRDEEEEEEEEEEDDAAEVLRREARDAAKEALRSAIAERVTDGRLSRRNES